MAIGQRERRPARQRPGMAAVAVPAAFPRRRAQPVVPITDASKGGIVQLRRQSPAATELASTSESVAWRLGRWQRHAPGRQPGRQSSTALAGPGYERPRVMAIETNGRDTGSVIPEIAAPESTCGGLLMAPRAGLIIAHPKTKQARRSPSGKRQ